MSKQVTVSGVFHDKESAEDALESLWRAGASRDSVTVAIPDAGTFKADDELDVDWPRGMARGAEAGAPVGALAGLALVAVANPVSGMALLAGIPGGIALGILLGGTVGLLAMIPKERVHELLGDHGAQRFLDQMHLVDQTRSGARRL